MNTFKIKDLMINVIPDRLRGHGGGSSLCSADQSTADHTPITPWTPVVMTAKLTTRFRALERIDAKKLDGAALEGFAHDLGRAAVGAAFIPGAALCTQDMATCAGNPTISPVASAGDFLRLDDLPEIRLHLTETLKAIEAVESRLEKRAVEHGPDLSGKLVEAAESLR